MSDPPKTPEEIVHHILDVVANVTSKYRLRDFANEQGNDLASDYRYRHAAAYDQINRELECIHRPATIPFNEFSRFGRFSVLERSSLDPDRLALIFQVSDQELPHRALFRQLSEDTWQVLQFQSTCLCCFNDDKMRQECDCCKGTGWEPSEV
jgi:hypothetical protein